MDGPTPAPPKNPRIDDSLVNTKQTLWFQPWFHFVVRNDLATTHSMFQGFGVTTLGRNSQWIDAGRATP